MGKKDTLQGQTLQGWQSMIFSLGLIGKGNPENFGVLQVNLNLFQDYYKTSEFSGLTRPS